MSNNSTEKMNILTVLVNLRNDIKNWCTYHFNKKLDNRFSEAETNKFVVTDEDSNIVSINKEEMLERLGIEIVSENNIPSDIEEGKIYFVYEE